MIKVSLFITTYNDPLRLRKTLVHYLKLRPQPGEILICDDGSRSETKDLIAGFAKISKTPIIHVYQENRGWDAPGIRNYGAIKSSGDYLLMTDGDCVPHPKFMADHLQAIQPGFFVFGNRSHVRSQYVPEFSTRADVLLKYILSRRIEKRVAAVRNPLENPDVHDRESFSGIDPLATLAICCNFGVWKKDFLSINGFDESFRRWWPEDAECAARLLNLGLKLKKFKNKCLVYHLDHGETSKACHDEFCFSEQSLLSRKIQTANGIKERIARLNLITKPS